MKGKTLFLRWFLPVLLVAGLSFGAAGQPLARVDAAPMPQATGDVVISEIQTSGDSGGGDEFIELYNRTNSTIDISGWEIWVSSSSGTYAKLVNIRAATSLDAGQHYLLGKEALYGGFNGATPDQWYTINVGIQDNMGVALKRSDGTISDQVGMSAGSIYKEGTPLAPLWGSGVDVSYERISDGAGNCVDTGNNAADFFRREPSEPQNSTDPAVICGSPTPTPRPVTPTSTAHPTRSVIINEVAWMGTIAFSGDEWIELYNPPGGAGDTSLDGWKLEALDGEPSISLSGWIPDGGYLILERGDGRVVNDVSGLVYNSGPLSDAGETLRLLDAGRHVIDTANGNGGVWPAGRATSDLNLHGTMDRTSTGAESDLVWTTNADPSSWSGHDANGNLIHGTPGGKNRSTPTPPPTSIHSPTPTRTPAFLPMWKTVVITEVAWMGTVASGSDEWIELYNTTTEPIDLEGWYLRSYRYNATADDFMLNLNIELHGTISVRTLNDPQSGFFLLERREQAVSDIQSDQLYSGELLNAPSGEILLLCSWENINVYHNCSINTKNQIVDFVNGRLSATGGANPWPAGKASPLYGSMERKNINDDPSSWYTHTGADPHYGLDANLNIIKGTPKHSNWAYTVTATPSPTATPTRTSTPLPAAAPILVINEFVPRPGNDWNNDGQVNVYDEFIEVTNAGTVNVNLSGYKLDDGQDSGSPPFTLPSVTLKPGEIAVFYASQTGIMLSDSGETVRLLRSSNSTVMDARTYPIAKSLDVSVCRLPDGNGSWLERCFPTPGRPNALIGDAPSPGTGKVISACFLPDSTPEEFVLAECEEGGLGIWNRSYWDASAALGEEMWIPEERDKGLVRYE